MKTIFSNQIPQSSPSLSGLKVRRFLKQGDTPLKAVPYETHQVFELKDHASTMEEREKHFHDLLFSPIPFEIWVIPSVFALQKMVGNIGKELLEDENTSKLNDFMNYHMNVPKTVRSDRQFAVVNRDHVQELLEKLNSVNISYLEIPEQVAQVIRVKYVEKEHNHEQTV